MDWGGVINIPPKFLKWVKIKGDVEGDDDGGGGGGGEDTKDEISEFLKYNSFGLISEYTIEGDEVHPVFDTNSIPFVYLRQDINLYGELDDVDLYIKSSLQVSAQDLIKNVLYNGQEIPISELFNFDYIAIGYVFPRFNNYEVHMMPHILKKINNMYFDASGFTTFDDSLFNIYIAECMSWESPD